MSSSSSSGYSDEDVEGSTASEAAPTPPIDLSGSVELAQVCSFCSTFRQPLRLPSFSRTELQEAILGASSGDTTHVELLAELHFKLAREHPTAKMDKMVQDWEKTLARKLQDNWRKEFAANPMRGSTAYRDLTVLERVKILEAMCHWKLESCAEIHKHIATLQKENNNEAIKKLRQGEIGTDDKGVLYWYFDDGCWVYAEDKPQWQIEERKPSYLVEFASAKRIRLSMNFDPDDDASMFPARTPLKKVKMAEAVAKPKKERSKKRASLDAVKDEKANTLDAKVKKEGPSSNTVKTEKKALSPSADQILNDVKEETSTPAIPATTQKMDISVLCSSASLSTGNEEDKVKAEVSSPLLNGDVQKNTSVPATTNEPVREVKSPRKDGVVKAEGIPATEDKVSTKSPRKESSVEANEDNNADHSHARVVTVAGSKKRMIIDDDSSDSAGDSDAPERSKETKPAATSPPPWKKRKPSADIVTAEATPRSDTNKDIVTKVESVKANGVPEKQEHVPEAVSADAKTANGYATQKKETIPDSVAKHNVDQAVTDAKADIESSRPPSASPTEPAAATESFDITCASCKKCYDMRYVDPPLTERPRDEWRCFECLVNDARGWPRRRKTSRREPFSPRSSSRPEEAAKKRRSSSKKRSSSSSSKKTKKSASKSRSSSSSTKKSHSSSSRRKSSSSKSSSRKSSSSSSSKKNKKRKSSSSHHHSSSHHRRRHHSHYHHEDFAKLVALFRERQEQRACVEDARITGELPVVTDEGPQGWRVVSSTLDGLRSLIESLAGGSLEQDRLRGRLIIIQKEQEKLEEQRRKEQELAWNILPRRQSSRIAIERLKHQTARDSDGENMDTDDERNESRRPGLRSNRSRSAASDGYDDKQKHDRAWRARRRHGFSDDEDEDEDEDEDDGVGRWIDWSLVKGSTRRLSTVCLALVDRLLKEESSGWFARPVDPKLDGCPNYLSVITHPIDLGTIRLRLESSFYQEWEIFKKDVDLVWKNCHSFNAPDTAVVQYANVLSKMFRTMCIAAERKGVGRMADGGSDQSKSNNDDDDVDMSSGAESKAESRSSVTKAWSESSASGSSGSSNEGDEPSSGGDSDSDAGGRKQRSTLSSSRKPRTRSRSTRSGRSESPVKSQSTRSTRSRSSKKRAAPSTSSEEETSESEDDAFSPVRKSRRQLRRSGSKSAVKDNRSDGNEVVSPAPPAHGVGSEDAPPPPPPPPQATPKKTKTRLVVSDSSSSDDSSGSDGNSSSSSSSDSDGSDSDVSPTAAAAKKPRAPPLSTEDGVVPPPPPPPTPPPVPKVKAQASTTKAQAAGKSGSKARTPSTKTPGGQGANSPALLNSYLSPSPSPSSSSDSSSEDSESSDSADSDSD